MKVLSDCDGIHYTITITTEVDDQYSVRWICPKCDKTFTSEVRFATEAEALGRAKADVYLDHHIPVHAITKRGIHARRRARS